MTNLKNLNLQEIEARVLKKNEAELIDENVNQLKRGEDANGGKFPEYASSDYYKGKASQGLLFNAGKHFNFYLEGDFTEKFFLKQNNNNSEIDSKDSKRDKLVNLVSGQPIFGIQKIDNLNLAPDFEKEILNDITKGI